MDVRPSRKPAMVGVDGATRCTRAARLFFFSTGVVVFGSVGTVREASPIFFCSRILPAYWAASLTIKPIFGLEGSKSGVIP